MSFQRLVDLPLFGVVEILEAGAAEAEVGLPEVALEAGVHAGQPLGVDQEAEALVEAALREDDRLLPSWPRSRVLELAPASWQKTLEQQETQQRLAANVFRAVALGEHPRAV